MTPAQRTALLQHAQRHLCPGRPFPPLVGGPLFRELADHTGLREDKWADLAYALGLWPHRTAGSVLREARPVVGVVDRLEELETLMGCREEEG